MTNRQSISQELDTTLQVDHSGAFTWRFAYARSLEARKWNDPGQDYLAFDQSPDKFLFALCDGVSQSFFGNLAAHLLGDRLVDWLDFVPPVFKEDVLADSLNNCLNELALKTNPEMVAYTLPESVPALLRQVLEQKRHLGSESTFACGRVDLPGPRFPLGRLLLAWMGDSRLRFWGPSGERSVELGPRFVTAQRWSSRQAAVGGQPNVFACTLQDDQGRPQVVRCLAYSDGLSVLDAINASIPNRELQENINRQDDVPTNDDISILELVVDMSAARNTPVPESKETILPPIKEAVEPEYLSAENNQNEDEILPEEQEETADIHPIGLVEDEVYPQDPPAGIRFNEPSTQPLKSKKWWRFWRKDDAL